MVPSPFFVPSFRFLVPSYRVLDPLSGCWGPGLRGPVLRDTARLSQRYPAIACYGVFGASTWPIGCDTPSPFSERFPLAEHAKWRCDTSPSKRAISAIRARYPMKTRQMPNGCDTPLCDSISKGYCAIWGGISHWAAKVQGAFRPNHPFGNHLFANPQEKQFLAPAPSVR